MRKILGIGILALILIAPTMLLAVETSVDTYKELLTAIRGVRSESQARVEKAVEQEKVREAWETGNLINEYILHKERADYGKQVLKRLADDLGMSQTELWYMVEFVRAYPILPTSGELTWSGYRELLSINDATERAEIAALASKEKWPVKKIREEVKKQKARKSAGTSPESTPGVGMPATHDVLEAIEPGPLDTYQIVRLKDGLKIDLGFGIYRDLAPVILKPKAEESQKRDPSALPQDDNFRGNDNIKAGDIIQLTSPFGKGGERGILKISPSPSLQKRGTVSDLYTYRASVVRVVDGDTFHALIDLGFGITVGQRVRLRRIDAPEILTADGKEAKALLEKILARDHGRVILQSHELDQHGRPIADVWAEGKSIDQELVDEGLAVKIED